MPGVTTAYQTGNHAGRPANGAGCILYSCTTHGLVYRDDGTAWSTFLTLGGGAPAAHAASHQNGGSDEIDVTGLVGAGGGGLGAWTDYTPSWTASTTNPTLGNGTLAGRYKELDGETLAVIINLVFGSTTTLGTGGYRFSLPAGFTSHASRIQTVAAHYLDGGTRHYSGVGKIDGGGTYFTVYSDALGASTIGIVQSNSLAWANTDQINLSGVIEVQ